MKTKKGRKLIITGIIALVVLTVLAITAFAESYNNLSYSTNGKVSFNGGGSNTMAVFYTQGDDGKRYYEYCADMYTTVGKGANYEGEDFNSHFGGASNKIRAILKYSPANGRSVSGIMDKLGITDDELAAIGYSKSQVNSGVCNGAAQAAIWSVLHHGSTANATFSGSDSALRKFLYEKYLQISPISRVASGDISVDVPGNDTILRKAVNTYQFNIEVDGTLIDSDPNPQVTVTGGGGTATLTPPTINGTTYTYTLMINGASTGDVFTVTASATGDKATARALINPEGKQKHIAIRVLPYTVEKSFTLTCVDPTLTFHNGYDGEISSSPYMANTAIVYPEDPKRLGYTFSGWDLPAPQVMPEDDLTITAQWSANPQTLTYYKNDGAPVEETANQSPTPKTDQEITLAAASLFERPGYTLVGWAEQRDADDADYACESAFAMPAKNVDLYAIWEEIEYTVQYDGNGHTGGTVPTDSNSYHINNPVTVKNDDDVSADPMVRDGYTFDVWNTQANGGGDDHAEGSTLLMPPINLTLFAQWSANDQTLTYNKNDGVAIPQTASETRKTDESFALAGVSKFTRTGYTLAGWMNSPNGTTADYGLGETYNMPAGNKTLYALWTLNSHNVYYQENGGTEIPDELNEDFGKLLSTPGETTKTGHTLAAWFEDAGLKFEWNFLTDTMPDKDLTLYAKWDKKTYTLSYDGNTADSGSVALQSGLFESSLTVAANGFAKNGYTFVEWNTKPDGKGDKYDPSDAFTVPAENTTLYAQWSADEQILTYYKNDGAAVERTLTHNPNPKSDEDITLAAADLFERPGYILIGWAEERGAFVDYACSSAYTMPANSMNLYAVWEAIDYTVEYDGNGYTGGTVPSDSNTYNVGNSVTAKSDNDVAADPIVRTGYTFDAWNTQANGRGDVVAEGTAFTMPASNVILFAQWTADDQILTYNKNDGTAMPQAATEIRKTDEELALAGVTKFMRAGYTLVGWMENPEGTTADYALGETFKMPAGNKTLYALWTINNHNVYYEENGGTDVSDESDVEFGSLLTTPEATTKIGHTFAGWFKDAGLNSEWSFAADTMPDTDITLYAKWDKKPYVLSYEGNFADSGSVDSKNGLFGLELTIAENGFVKSGFAFVEWNTQADGSGDKYNPSEPFIVPAKNITLYAQWVKNGDVVLRYEGNLADGGSVGSHTGPHSTDVLLRENGFVRTGYNFVGWNTQLDGNGTTYGVGDEYTLPETDSILYAQWEKQVYTIAYEQGTHGRLDGEPSEQVAYEEFPQNVPDVNRDQGYTFAGWSTDGGETLLTTNEVETAAVTQDTTYTAYYRIAWFSVRFFEADGVTQIGDTQRVNWNTAATLETAPEIVGTTFDGWNLTGDNNGEVDSLNNVRENIDAVSRYSDIIYVVTFVDPDGTVIGTDAAVYGGAATAPTETEKDGFKFLGWDKEFNNITKDITVTARYEVIGTIEKEDVPKAFPASVEDEDVPKAKSSNNLAWLWILLGALGAGIIIILLLWRNVIITYYDVDGDDEKKRVIKKLRKRGDDEKVFEVKLDDIKEETRRVDVAIKKGLSKKIGKKEVKTVNVQIGRRILETSEVPEDIDERFNILSVEI